VDPALYEARHSFVWNLGEDLLPLLDARGGERILDLGCGTGQLTAKIAEAGAIVTGIDRSPGMVAQARQNYPNLEFKLADATAFSDAGKFDAVFSNAALHWIPEAEKVIECIAGNLRAGGRFIAEFGGRRNIARFLRAAQISLEQRGLEFRTPWYFPGAGEYASLLERHGFEVRMAFHFDRLTKLDEGEDAMRDWIEMFGGVVLEAAPKSQRAEMVRGIEDRLRPELFLDGRWHMDYVRLRICAELRPDPPDSTRH
jgi:trans-aconitate methyltransferase